MEAGKKRAVMTQLETSIAKQVAQAAATSHRDRTGQAPESVAVLLSGDTLVVTLHGALSLAEQALAKSEEGAAKVEEFHRRLFASSLEPLATQIKKIVGSDVLEAITEIKGKVETLAAVFATGTMVQVFRLSGEVAAGAWSGVARGGKE
jgi:uncharacterized protein YbcI